VKNLQPFLARELFCQGTHDLEVSKRVGNDTGKPRPCRFYILRLDGENQVFCFDTAVVAVFKLTAEHLRIALADMVEAVTQGGDLDTLYKFLTVHAVAHKGELHTDRSVMRVIHIA